MSRYSFLIVLVSVLLSGCVGWLLPGGVGYECTDHGTCRDGLECVSYVAVMEGTEDWAVEHGTSREGHCSDGREQVERPYGMGEVVMAWVFLVVGIPLVLFVVWVIRLKPRRD
jgi:hypothetical protein